jgi:hypothetical protein
VQISYEPWDPPEVTIMEPKLEHNDLIHMYPDGSLCLYDWRQQPWQNKWHLHETIIPWTAEWLVFYELFLLTGVWHGRSVAHGCTPPEADKTWHALKLATTV